MTILNTTLSFLLLTFMFSALPVFAESSPTTEPRQNSQKNSQQIKQEKKDTQVERRLTTTQENLNQRRQNATRIANNIVSKLEKRFEYLNKIKVRLQTKIDSLKTTKKMDDALAKLTLYDTATNQYTNDLNKLKADIALINTSDKPASLIPSLRVDAKVVQNDLKSLHQILVDTLKLIIKSPKITQ